MEKYLTFKAYSSSTPSELKVPAVLKITSMFNKGPLPFSQQAYLDQNESRSQIIFIEQVKHWTFYLSYTYQSVFFS